MSIQCIESVLNQNILKDLKIKIEPKFKYDKARYIYPLIREYEIITIPFAFAVKALNLKRRKRDTFKPMGYFEFEGVLRQEQLEVKAEAISSLNKTGSVLLSMYCGFGKTITAINIASQIKLRTLIIVNKIVLIEQWHDALTQFCPCSKILTITPSYIKKHNFTEDFDFDFVLINALNVQKIHTSFYNDFGTVIVDEAHLIMAESLSQSLLSVRPRYLIGLTATPYRPDGLDGLLSFFFGDVRVIRELNREHKIYKVMTNFKPTIELTKQGQINWSVVLESQSNNVERNALIISILTRFKDRNFLVLVKRVEQGNYLVDELQKINESVTSLLGSNQVYDKDARILVGTVAKVGVGFDRKKTDALLLAGDVEQYFIQYLGRVMRTKETIPLIFDLVDDFTLLKKHYASREQVYKNHGGLIEKYKIE